MVNGGEAEATIYHSPSTIHFFFVELLNKRGPDAGQERGPDANGAFGRGAPVFGAAVCVSRRLKFVLLPPLFDQLAQRDREVACGALKAVGATLQLIDAARTRARSHRGQRVLGLQIQAFRRRLHLLLRACERWLRGRS